MIIITLKSNDHHSNSNNDVSILILATYIFRKTRHISELASPTPSPVKKLNNLKTRLSHDVQS